MQVILTDSTPTEYVEGNEHLVEDGKWLRRCGYTLGKSNTNV